MKLLVHFLCICLLSLSFLNCEDGTSVSESTIVKIEKSQGTLDQDHCPPLCTCNCCGQPLVVHPQAYNSNVIRLAIPRALAYGYSHQFVSNYTQNIWQPPKLNFMLNA